MKEYTTEAIRNIVLASHSSSGKTILCEAFLNFTGATTRMGKIEDGTTISDFDDEEKTTWNFPLHIGHTGRI